MGLAACFALSITGTSFAVSNTADSAQTSAEAVYENPNVVNPPTLVPTATPTPTPTEVPVGELPDEGGALPETDEGEGPVDEDEGAAPRGVEEPAEVQETRQLGADTGGGLPATGWAVIPVALLGMAMLAGGAVTRRKSRSDS
jgi:hypothetical protein